MTQPFSEHDEVQRVREGLGDISLEPDQAEVQQIDQELPVEWTQELELYQAEYTPEQLQQYLDMPLKLPPEQELNQLTQEAIQGLDLDEIFDEINLDEVSGDPPAHEYTHEHELGIDLDFDR
jgi:hypothetical protein